MSVGTKLEMERLEKMECEESDEGSENVPSASPKTGKYSVHMYI